MSGAKVGLLVREPVGVVGAIIPWNGPILITAFKVAPALIAGCTVVIKGSPEAPGHALLMAEAAEALAAAFARVRVGDPFDPVSQMGPVATRRQRDQVLGYIERGRADGYRVAGGGGRPRHLDRGFFVEPTVFAGVDNDAAIAREEIFGPVLSVIPAADEADAVRIANDSPFGLNGAVFTNDADRAYAVARRMRTGTVGHNGHLTDFTIAFGGFKQSGVGREGGIEGLYPYLETKTILLDGRPTHLDAAGT